MSRSLYVIKRRLDSPGPRRLSVQGGPLLERGQATTAQLTEEQAASLDTRGYDVEKAEGATAMAAAFVGLGKVWCA